MIRRRFLAALAGMAATPLVAAGILRRDDKSTLPNLGDPHPTFAWQPHTFEVTVTYTMPNGETWTETLPCIWRPASC